jgi:type IV pilus assembly protein PilM
MFSSTKTKSTVGLEIAAGSIAATEIRTNGSVEVTGHGVAPLEPGIFREGEVVDAEALGEALKDLFSREKLSRNVRLGIANQRIAVRTLHLPAIESDSELETAIRFQAQDHIPMPLEQAVLDWQVSGYRTGENGTRTMEVTVAAARRDMIGSLTSALSAAGLRPVGIDLSAFGMIRALARAPHDAVGSAQFVSAPALSYEERATAGTFGGSEDAPVAAAVLYCNLGDATNLAVVHNDVCMFTRISGFGIEGIAQKLAERRRLTLEHARQWLAHVGLEHPVGTIDGDPELVSAAREALIEGQAKLTDEIRLSLEYYAAQDGSRAVEGVVACGPGTTIPGLVAGLEQSLGYRFSIGRPPALANLSAADAARLTLSFGLALES